MVTTSRQVLPGPARSGRPYSDAFQENRYPANLPPPIPNYDFIEEVYFSDLYLILLAKKNWKNNFEKIFHDRDTLRIKLAELASLRNLPAHSKDLTAHIEKKIQVYYDDIILHIENHVRKSING